MKLPPLSALLLLGLSLVPAALADEAKATQATITALLQEFLARNTERAQHDGFWADDLVYTSSLGIVRSKAEIMRGLAEDQAAGAQPKPPAPAYSAEDIVVRAYGTTAALTFRLVARSPDGTVQYYRNSGTFLLRGGRWQVVTWQATKVPETRPAP